ncbi:MAG: cytidine deaminase [Anaerolineae bacterium]|nr:cytidine deaminase [Anaerolineae bacterium]
MTKNRDIEKLIALARAARKRAYAPYSRYAVGAAVLAKSGKVYTGCNIENAAYPSGLCAERVAIFKAVSEGERELVAMVVVTSNLGSPCGACRQVFSEFADDEAIIVLASARGKRRKTYRMREILPDRFGARDLQRKPSV